MTFEELSNELEKIVKRLEKSDVGIEESTSLYERGVEIAKQCYEILNNNKSKIKILQNELNNLSNDDE